MKKTEYEKATEAITETILAFDELIAKIDREKMKFVKWANDVWMEMEVMEEILADLKEAMATDD